MEVIRYLFNRLLFRKEFLEYKRLWETDAPIFHRTMLFEWEKGLSYYMDKFGCLPPQSTQKNP